MSITSYSTPDRQSLASEVMIVDSKEKPTRRKVLEEDEYLGRMAKIIRRDFFSGLENPSQSDDTISECGSTNKTSTSYLPTQTPVTERSQLSTSTMRSRLKATSLGLNEFLDKYTSEDNEYFDKLQRKELRRHRVKYPWLYKEKDPHNKQVSDQLKLQTSQERSIKDSSTKMIDWPHNPMNTLFYPPSDDPDSLKKQQSTINYRSNKYINDPIFKMPLPPATNQYKPSAFNRFVDKIGIDGNLANGSETPSMNGYSFVAPPESPKLGPIVIDTKIKTEPNKFFIPNESPRDELAHRIYQDRVSRSIRTPKNKPGSTPLSNGTPSSRRSYASFSFSPERVKNTPDSRRR